MGMTIDESISELKWVRKVNEEILKTDIKEIDVDSAWIKHWENVIKSLDTAIDTMRKYQIIKEIIADWWRSDGGTFEMSESYWLRLISEVIEDGLKSLLQHHSSKASILLHSVFFIVQLSHSYMTTRETIALTTWTFVGKAMSLLFNAV